MRHFLAHDWLPSLAVARTDLSCATTGDLAARLRERDVKDWNYQCGHDFAEQEKNDHRVSVALELLDSLPTEPYEAAIAAMPDYARTEWLASGPGIPQGGGDKHPLLANVALRHFLTSLIEQPAVSDLVHRERQSADETILLSFYKALLDKKFAAELVELHDEQSRRRARQTGGNCDQGR